MAMSNMLFSLGKKEKHRKYSHQKISLIFKYLCNHYLYQTAFVLNISQGPSIYILLSCLGLEGGQKIVFFSYFNLTILMFYCIS